MEENSHPRVSVIISFYNEERFLAEAIESVLHQEYSNWEIILIDDGSSDGSTVLAKEYASKFPDKIIYAEHEGHANKGLSGSRNHGISISKGELIAILDADDFWYPKKLQEQVHLMHTFKEVALVCEASEYWYDWTENSKKNLVIQVGASRDRIIDPPELLNTLYPLSTGAAPCPSALVFRRNIFEKYGGFEAHFTGKLQLFEDQAFLHKIYLHEKVYVSSSCNNRYRKREGSLVQKFATVHTYMDIKKYFLVWLQSYIREERIEDRKINKLLRRAMEPYNSPFTYYLRKKFTGFKKRLLNA